MPRPSPIIHLMELSKETAIPSKPSGAVRILLFSDIHIGLRPSLRELLFSKRILGYLNHLVRRRSRIRPERIQRLADLLPEIKPDAVLCTGDLSSIGLSSEFLAAEELLQPFRPYHLLYVPGNHDRYVRDPDALETLRRVFRNLNPTGLELDTLPAIQQINHLAIILLNPARPVPYHLSCGILDEKMQQSLTNLLKTLPPQTPRIIASHFPALMPNGTLVGWRHGLRGARHLAEKLFNSEVDAILSGHEHHPYCFELGNGNCQLCAGSLTLASSYAICDFLPIPPAPPGGREEWGK